MTRLILAAALVAGVCIHAALAQGRPGRGRPYTGSPTAAAARPQAVADSQTPAATPIRQRQQLRDPASCPREDRPGCGDPQEVRQHQWCGREPGSPAPAWRDAPRRGGRGAAACQRPMCCWDRGRCRGAGCGARGPR